MFYSYNSGLQKMANIEIQQQQATYFYYFYFTKESNMNKLFHDILKQNEFSQHDLMQLISASGDEHKALLKKAGEIQVAKLGKKVYFRGLIEFSNICMKNCYYCGIRKDNQTTHRYNLNDESILEAARFAWQNKYGSVVLQSGERHDKQFINRIELLLSKIKHETQGEVGITISMGEQSNQTYQKWFDAGAHRYLLRIETTNPQLYKSLHPSDENHDFNTRLNCLKALKAIGYQTGTGVMIGLPGQTIEDLANDLLFFKSMNIDMVGMGPFIEHKQTPLYVMSDQLWPIDRRLQVALNMIAALRLLMPDINIAAATALQAIDPMGREKALRSGANIIMPNITPTENRRDYQLYENKPCLDEGANECSNCLNIRIEMADREIGLAQWGDSQHFKKRISFKQKGQ